VASPANTSTVEQVLEQQGRSITWLARKTGVSVPYAWRMLKGERPLTSEFKATAADALGVPEGLLFPIVDAPQDIAS
jgi:transcriptional regulator with XRE-family HTH domain